MRGKFITTNLKLAVLASGKKSKLILVNETKASLENFTPIWSKANSTTKGLVQDAVKIDALEMVF